MARRTASAKWAAGPALDGWRATLLGLGLNEGLDRSFRTLHCAPIVARPTAENCVYFLLRAAADRHDAPGRFCFGLVFMILLTSPRRRASSARLRTCLGLQPSTPAWQRARCAFFVRPQRGLEEARRTWKGTGCLRSNVRVKPAPAARRRAGAAENAHLHCSAGPVACRWGSA